MKVRNLRYSPTNQIVEQPYFNGTKLTKWVHNGIVIWEDGEELPFTGDFYLFTQGRLIWCNTISKEIRIVSTYPNTLSNFGGITAKDFLYLSGYNNQPIYAAPVNSNFSEWKSQDWKQIYTPITSSRYDYVSHINNHIIVINKSTDNRIYYYNGTDLEEKHSSTTNFFPNWGNSTFNHYTTSDIVPKLLKQEGGKNIIALIDIHEPTVAKYTVDIKSTDAEGPYFKRYPVNGGLFVVVFEEWTDLYWNTTESIIYVSDDGKVAKISGLDGCTNFFVTTTNNYLYYCRSGTHDWDGEEDMEASDYDESAFRVEFDGSELKRTRVKFLFDTPIPYKDGFENVSSMFTFSYDSETGLPNRDIWASESLDNVGSLYNQTTNNNVVYYSHKEPDGVVSWKFNVASNKLYVLKIKETSDSVILMEGSFIIDIK